MSNESCGVILADNSGQQIDLSKIWRFFKNRTIFQSTKRPGICIEINNGKTTVINSKGDIHSNDTDKEELLTYHPYFKYQLNEDEDTLFKEFHTLGDDFTIMGSELRPVVSEMIDHFRYKNGIDYKNTMLSNHVKENNETIQYKNTIEEILKYELNKVKGDLDAVDTKEIKFYIQNEARYPNYEKDDMFSGLFVAIHAMWGNDVEVKSYMLKENYYQGTISIKFFDHFGLGKEDMLNPTKRFGMVIPDLAGIRAWYVLQHWKKFKGKFKPFVDYSIVEYEFEGDLESTQYNYVRDKIDGIKLKIAAKNVKPLPIANPSNATRK